MKLRLPNEFDARDYQLRAMQHFDSGGRFGVYVWARRTGKDTTFAHQTCKALHQRTGTYYHMLPSYAQAKKSVWDAIDDRGRRMIDQIFPPVLRESQNESDMQIKFRNGSMWQLIGADNYNSVVGANPVGIVMSEYALIDPRAWQFFRPILMQNNGWVVFIGTPRGYNHFHDQLEIARRETGWHWSVIDAVQSGMMSHADIEREIRTGMPEELVRQEYLCDFAASNVGAILGARIERAEREGRISDDVQYDGNAGPVVVSSDIGYRDKAAFWFWQGVPGGFQLLGYDEDSGLDAEDWIDRLQHQDLRIDKLLLPHDARAKTFSSRHSVLEQFLKAGFNCAIVPNMRIVDRINAARSIMQRCKFARKRCTVGLQMLRDWSFRFIEETKTFSREPNHDYASHGGDAFSYGAQMMENYTGDGEQDDRYRDIGSPASYTFTLDQLWADREAQHYSRHSDN